MEDLIFILILSSFLSLITFGTLILIKLIFKKGFPVKRLLMMLGVSFAVMIVSLIMAPSDNIKPIKEISKTGSDTTYKQKEEKPKKEELGTRKNPLEKNEPVNVKFESILYGKVDLDIELVETIYGEDATKIIVAGNKFNNTGETGEEYILAKFHVRANSIEKEPFHLNNSLFSAVSQDGKSYEGFASLSGLDPNIRVDLYEGAEHEGFAYFLVNSDDNPLGVFNRGRDSEIWFILR